MQIIEMYLSAICHIKPVDLNQLEIYLDQMKDDVNYSENYTALYVVGR